MFKIKSKIHDYHVEFIDELKMHSNEGDIFIIDSNVHKLYKKHLPKGVFNVLTIASSESAKEFKEINFLISCILLNGFKKNNRIVAIGGGVIQDISGFIASILFRGVDWVFYPTTLVSQADSCIGGKTSINFAGYKNLIGTFYPPKVVFIWDKFLRTLPEEEMMSGYGEILHYYMLFGKRNWIWELKRHCGWDAVLDSNIFVKKSLGLKRKYVLEDEFDKGIRNLFNYGHTFGHAIESLTKFRIKHGIAVTIGMDMANFLSMRRGFITEKQFTSMRKMIEFNFVEWKDFNVYRFIKILQSDKKNTCENINFILPHEKVFKKTAIKNDWQLISDLKEYKKWAISILK